MQVGFRRTRRVRRPVGVYVPPALEPVIQFSGVGVNRPELGVPMPVNRKAFSLLPSPDRRDVAIQVSRYLFPRLEALSARSSPESLPPCGFAAIRPPTPIARPLCHCHKFL